jgi:hypothetical protein
MERPAEKVLPRFALLELFKGSLMLFWIKFLVAVALVEAVVEITSTAEVFDGIRAFLDGKGEKPRKIGVFSRCPYCMSVWFGVGAAYLLQIMGFFSWMGWFEPILWGFLVHRASNLWHELISRHLSRIPFNLFIRSWTHKEDK